MKDKGKSQAELVAAIDKLRKDAKSKAEEQKRATLAAAGSGAGGKYRKKEKEHASLAAAAAVPKKETYIQYQKGQFSPFRFSLSIDGKHRYGPNRRTQLEAIADRDLIIAMKEEGKSNTHLVAAIDKLCKDAKSNAAEQRRARAAAAPAVAEQKTGKCFDCEEEKKLSASAMVDQVRHRICNACYRVRRRKDAKSKAEKQKPAAAKQQAVKSKAEKQKRAATQQERSRARARRPNDPG